MRWMIRSAATSRNLSPRELIRQDLLEKAGQSLKCRIWRYRWWEFSPPAVRDPVTVVPYLIYLLDQIRPSFSLVGFEEARKTPSFDSPERVLSCLAKEGVSELFRLCQDFLMDLTTNELLEHREENDDGQIIQKVQAISRFLEYLHLREVGTRRPVPNYPPRA